ncbi:hypothetical protein BD749_1042 [Pontibacter ramchanderi]|uniref:Uncharacterized protein n=1 Tax=Pontibacter ramchanderi TaxID=1179743 RepID=A0A2N3V383_9BACT|nr:hypothetical protein BD749_1042 [Pontibacter ramchanderi]
MAEAEYVTSNDNTIFKLRKEPFLYYQAPFVKEY